MSSPPEQRRLLVVRHAKSSWKSGAGSDHDRPLNGRGRRDAPRMAAHLAGLGWTPDAVWSSDARRTRETLELFLPEFTPKPAVRLDGALYHAGLGDVRAGAADLDDGARTVLLLGHNPGWEAMASQLTGREIHLTTCNAVLLLGPGNTWTRALHEPWKLVAIARPLELFPTE